MKPFELVGQVDDHSKDVKLPSIAPFPSHRIRPMQYPLVLSLLLGSI